MARVAAFEKISYKKVWKIISLSTKLCKYLTIGLLKIRDMFYGVMHLLSLALVYYYLCGQRYIISYLFCCYFGAFHHTMLCSCLVFFLITIIKFFFPFLKSIMERVLNVCIF